MNTVWRAGIAVAAVAAACAAAWWFWAAGSPPPATAQAPPAPMARGEVAPVPPAASTPAEPPPPALPLAADEVVPALQALLGRDTVLRWLLTDDVARRVVATVDNLGSAHAPARLWPVRPTEGRFAVAPLDGIEVIAAANASRYTAFVALLVSVPAGDAVALYTRLQPLLQTAYEDLGYPGRRFHARLVAVIDLLLATPQARQPLALHLVDVQGPVPSTRPWVRYEFADPALQALPAGQKILLRVGPDNARRLQQWLRGFRQALVEGAAPADAVPR